MKMNKKYFAIFFIVLSLFNATTGFAQIILTKEVLTPYLLTWSSNNTSEGKLASFQLNFPNGSVQALGFLNFPYSDFGTVPKTAGYGGVSWPRIFLSKPMLLKSTNQVCSYKARVGVNLNGPGYPFQIKEFATTAWAIDPITKAVIDPSQSLNLTQITNRFKFKISPDIEVIFSFTEHKNIYNQRYYFSYSLHMTGPVSGLAGAGAPFSHVPFITFQGIQLTKACYELDGPVDPID